jgi:hypothetical protein
VWDAKLLTTFNVIGVGFFDYGIISMNFSQQVIMISIRIIKRGGLISSFHIFCDSPTLGHGFPSANVVVFYHVQ